MYFSDLSVNKLVLLINDIYTTLTTNTVILISMLNDLIGANVK